jgi:phage shock protein E
MESAPSFALSGSEAFALVEAGAILVDVRTKEEFEEGSLVGALNLTSENIEGICQVLNDSNHEPIVLFCKSGGRSGMVAEVLASLGYTKVKNAGGYKELVPFFSQG